ncbi:MAG TPA: hypothetical protein PKL65_14315, partial [Bacteroidales bacterium]|nr:hypothetical protein [Bacteroidales bacterium]
QPDTCGVGFQQPGSHPGEKSPHANYNPGGVDFHRFPVVRAGKSILLFLGGVSSPTPAVSASSSPGLTPGKDHHMPATTPDGLTSNCLL